MTALTRYGFSAPIQSLARHGFLDGRYRLFDYGCGRGDDVRGLIENGLEAAGWDPYHAPDRPIQAADIVNLGFVINVIEDFDERLEALMRAWSLAERLPVVSVMLANRNDPRGARFCDGVMTQRGTFQKYFSQSEIKAFLDQVLDEEAIAVAPGVLYVFRDKDAEQRFLVDRYRRRRQPLRAPTPRPRIPSEREPRARHDDLLVYLALQQSSTAALIAIWNAVCNRTSSTSSATMPPPTPRPPSGCSGSPISARSRMPAAPPPNRVWAGSIRAARCNCTRAWSSVCRRCCGSMSPPPPCSMATVSTPIWSRSTSPRARSV
ncbi:DNA phosphorothioation-associated putative methyltransferase [Allochromatium tepidum]|uniref:DNA phosphorothioation-associated methyltransferase n=1 Tax=Allochromatium tepidum TaxID=553982 RepID=A0ABM7QIF7_9GAMM|nr:DNA phosphorothioation-associated putative methyltransferase [Allochromatium tepidum]BCU05562.1 hypothetical protein Atep_02390 [Allochromatium tepidum]